jgi:protein TonB
VPQDNPQPDQSPDPTPEQLGLDADASAGSDSFGLAARSGGSDIVGGTGTAIFGRYTSRLASAINDCLSSDEQLRKQGGYSGSVHVWLDADGRITRMTMWQSTGKPEVDALIPQSKGCRSLRIADGPPPIEMPQPVNLKIVSRG